MTLNYFSPVLVELTEAFRASEEGSDSIPLQFFVDDWIALQEVIFATSRDSIESLETGYVLLKPIPVKYEHQDSGVIASFVEADIAISGVDQHDAYQALLAEILDTFDALTVESELGRHAAYQLAILSEYIEQE